jgi:hypothetical protein
MRSGNADFYSPKTCCFSRATLSAAADRLRESGIAECESRLGWDGTGLLITDGRGSTFWFKKFLERDREEFFVFNPETSS